MASSLKPPTPSVPLRRPLAFRGVNAKLRRSCSITTSTVAICKRTESWEDEGGSVSKASEKRCQTSYTPHCLASAHPQQQIIHRGNSHAPRHNAECKIVYVATEHGLRCRWMANALFLLTVIHTLCGADVPVRV